LLPVSRLPRQMNKYGENGRAVAGFIHKGSGIRKGRLVWGVFLGSFFARAKNDCIHQIVMSCNFAVNRQKNLSRNGEHRCLSPSIAQRERRCFYKPLSRSGEHRCLSPSIAQREHRCLTNLYRAAGNTVAFRPLSRSGSTAALQTSIAQREHRCLTNLYRAAGAPLPYKPLSRSGSTAACLCRMDIV